MNDKLMVDRELEYAQKLAVWLWEKHWKEESPGFRVCWDMMGVLSQIDNMIAGMKRK